ncbi:YafY family protein [Arthrobacter sp. ATA002]|uniref:helix-turn-helix transcriptional regulator n=1 Tax=Arthrobacter sp. ATA002 TaxID=2991715 RepID=UPI0022A6CF87|nr:YafY family protein [Arthrobacter sp. ATA002]WAP53045.1 YafY family protein [Arthrobacter sp. ATA002]
MTTSTRILELLSLLQARRHWTGPELAGRLGVSPRTLRRDIGGLRELGYPVLTTRGTGGGYQLGSGGALPPLVLTEEEAAATVLGLKDVATGTYAVPADAAVSAIAKIVQVLPARLRGRISSLAGVAGGFGQPGAALADVTVLTTIALACRDLDAVEFHYRSTHGEGTRRVVQPHRIVTVEKRLYLIAWDSSPCDWRVFRIDRVSAPRRTGKRFAPRRLPVEDPMEFVRSRLGSLPAKYRVHATVQAPAERVREEIAHYGVVEASDAGSCEVFIAAEQLDWAMFCLCSLGMDFTVHGPEDAVGQVKIWADRLRRSATPGTGR